MELSAIAPCGRGTSMVAEGEQLGGWSVPCPEVMAAISTSLDRRSLGSSASSSNTVLDLPFLTENLCATHRIRTRESVPRNRKPMHAAFLSFVASDQPFLRATRQSVKQFYPGLARGPTAGKQLLRPGLGTKQAWWSILCSREFRRIAALARMHPICWRALGFPAVFATPIFHNRVGRFADPFFVASQLFQFPSAIRRSTIVRSLFNRRRV